MDLAARGIDSTSPAALDDSGLTFDTGALNSLERRRPAIRKLFAAPIAHDVPIVVPTVAIAECWRRGAHEKERTAIRRAVHVEALGAHLARLAGSPSDSFGRGHRRRDRDGLGSIAR